MTFRQLLALAGLLFAAAFTLTYRQHGDWSALLGDLEEGGRRWPLSFLVFWLVGWFIFARFWLIRGRGSGGFLRVRWGNLGRMIFAGFYVWCFSRFCGVVPSGWDLDTALGPDRNPEMVRYYQCLGVLLLTLLAAIKIILWNKPDQKEGDKS